jgi:hypothetical protein
MLFAFALLLAVAFTATALPPESSAQLPPVAQKPGAGDNGDNNAADNGDNGPADNAADNGAADNGGADNGPADNGADNGPANSVGDNGDNGGGDNGDDNGFDNEADNGDDDDDNDNDGGDNDGGDNFSVTERIGLQYTPLPTLDLGPPIFPTPVPQVVVAQPSPSPLVVVQPAVPVAQPSPTRAPAVAQVPTPRAGGFPIELAVSLLAGGTAALGTGAYFLRRRKRS